MKISPTSFLLILLIGHTRTTDLDEKSQVPTTEADGAEAETSGFSEKEESSVNSTLLLQATANETVLEEAVLNATDANGTLANSTNDAAAPPAKPPVLKKVKCLKKPVIFNVSSAEGVTLEEKSKEMQDQLDPKVRLVNASHLLQLFSEAHNPNVTNRSMEARLTFVHKADLLFPLRTFGG